MNNNFRYFPNHVKEMLALKAEKISPAFCAGRRSNPNSDEINFTLAFFLQCSDREISVLNDLVGEDKEVLVQFFKEIPGQSAKRLTLEEMAERPSRRWSAKRMEMSWDELREIEQPILAITFLLA